jgi:hypothetical protein
MMTYGRRGWEMDAGYGNKIMGWEIMTNGVIGWQMRAEDRIVPGTMTDGKIKW